MAVWDASESDARIPPLLPPRDRADTGPAHAPSDLAPHHQEADMGQAISTQHPAVVLRSRYQQLRALLVVAMIAVVGLTVAVVALATSNEAVQSTPSAARIGVDPAMRTDGGPEESAVANTLGARQPSGHPDESVVAHAVAGP
jgi:hypothetical protein